MLSQQDQELRRNVPGPLFAGGSHFCGSGAGEENTHNATKLSGIARRMQALWGEPERASRTLAVIVA